MNKPIVTIKNGTQEKYPSRAASMPEITQEYTVTRVTAERVAINHLETTSSASHSFLSFILMSCHDALRHMAKLMVMNFLLCFVTLSAAKVSPYNTHCD